VKRRGNEMAFLGEGEKIILQDSAKSDFFGKGTLYLTNERIVFEAFVGGIFSKSSEVKINQGISTIKAVSVPAGKTLQMQFEGNVEPTVIYVSNPEKWEAAIKSAQAVRT
jgi:hypothetical protein